MSAEPAAGQFAQAEFDAYCDQYRQDHAASIRVSGEDVDFFAAYKARDARRLAAAAECRVETMLDFGSGIGNAVGPLRDAFPDAALTCLDVSERSLDVSRRLHGDGPSYVAYDGQTLPFADASFDLVFTACVFRHILESGHIALLAQLRRVLKPGGLFVLYEHNPWNPLTRHVVASCPFDANAVLITAPEMKRRPRKGATVRTEYRVFFPKALARLRPLERALTARPLGGQYVLGARP
ncbi:class I SAM-dependent methyltransferase [Novosphingobium sp. KCTC 2891]|uniref:class I SAM-dependent methyltransferase n=1 Tax=Novosphingobium sp. KCTC 2891 TaxID=2989730 RepID=UPI00222313C6|nr:class I SAM-dependent methyltransferase [Novosphingobium sp. KCTC 2891]MCW1383298.1 class I SAM-dependent methyltransferase [Novosphingobium sp. KCTC 2891]